MVRLDIGCGLAKQWGFIGLDRSPMPGVDVVADLNRPLPFLSDSVDLLVACHSLEHVSDLVRTMQEVYRVCKHSAQVCIIAPYANQLLNIANPYHTSHFNEHTPRFWTSHKATRVLQEEFDHPHAHDWGLSHSDNSDPGIDIRLVRLEFFYFPEYLGMPPDELRRLRRESLDVCDQVMYHLLVWKDPSPAGEATFDAVADNLQPFVPALVAHRHREDSEIIIQKLTERLEVSRRAVSLHEGHALSLQAGMAKCSSDLETLKVEEQRLNSELASLRVVVERWRAQEAVQRAEAERWRTTSLTAQEEVRNRSREADRLTAELEQRRTELEAMRSGQELAARRIAVLAAEAAARDSGLAQLERARAAEVERLQSVAMTASEVRSLREALGGQVETLRAEVASALVSSVALEKQRTRVALLQAELDTANTMLGVAAEQNRRLAADIESLRLNAQRLEDELALQTANAAEDQRLLDNETAGGRLITSLSLLRFGSYVIGRIEGLSLGLGSEQEDLIAACSKAVPGAARCMVGLSGDIRSVPYLEFKMLTPVGGGQCLQLALHAPDCHQTGVIGVELVTFDMQIAAQVVAPLSNGARAGIVVFPVSPGVPSLRAGWFLRVFARDAKRCVRILTLRRGAAGFAGELDFPVALPAPISS